MHQEAKMRDPNRLRSQPVMVGHRRDSGRGSNPSSPSGTVLVCVLVCMSVASALVVATTRTALQAHRQLRRQRQLQQTELLVEAGIERAVWRLGEDAEYRGETWNLAPNTLPGYGAPRVQIVVTSDPVRSSLSHRIHVVARLPVGSTRFLQRSHVLRVAAGPGTTDPHRTQE
jgi:hypothetical protein